MSNTYFQQTQFNPNNRNPVNQTPAQGFANLQFTRNDIFNLVNQFVTDPSGSAMDNIAFNMPIKPKDEYALIYHYLGANAKIQGASNFTPDQLLKLSGSQIAKLKAGLDFGIGGIDYIDPMGNDQIRKYGAIYEDAIRDNRIILSVENYSLDKYKATSGNTLAVGIPLFNTSINLAGVSTPVALEVSAFKAWSNYGTTNNCLCNVKTSCANAKQRIYIVKKRNYNDVNATPEHIVADIDSVVYNPDGSMVLMLVPAPTRANPMPTNVPGQNAWENPGDLIEPGDVIMFGSFQPTNLCDPSGGSCYSTDLPEPTIYCTTPHVFTGCVFNANNQPSVSTMEMQLPARYGFERGMMETVRNMTIQWGNDILYSDQNYAAGNRRPIPVPNDANSWTYSDCDIIPFSMLGVITAVKKYGKLIEHYFSSCYDICGTEFLKQIMEILAENITSTNSQINYDSASWMLTGDIKGVRAFEKSQSAQMYNQMPFQFGMEQAMGLKNSMVESAKPTADNSTTLFGAKWNNVKEVYDSIFASTNSDTLYLIPEINVGYRWYASNKKQMVNNKYGMDIVTLDAVANNGQKVTPTIYSNSYSQRHNLTKETMEMVPTDGCSVRYDAYMNVGLFPKAQYLMNSHIFKFGYDAVNKNFNPNLAWSATNQPMIRTSLSSAPCNNTCNNTEALVRTMFQTSLKEGVYS